MMTPVKRTLPDTERVGMMSERIVRIIGQTMSGGDERMEESTGCLDECFRLRC